MSHALLRKIIRGLGIDGMARDRFDRLVAGQDAAATMPRLVRDFFSLYAPTVPELWLLQLGANDGQRDDTWGFLREAPNVRSLLVEPQTACVKRLQFLARDRPRWRILPVAFGEADGAATLHRFAADTEQGIQLDVFASFDRARLEEPRRHFNLQSPIVAEPVETCTLPTLLARGGAPRVDIAVCDIEGFDHAFISQLPALSSLPAIVVFEHRWLTPHQRRACYRLLSDAGYGLIQGMEDACAIRVRPPGT